MTRYSTSPSPRRGGSGVPGRLFGALVLVALVVAVAWYSGWLPASPPLLAGPAHPTATSDDFEPASDQQSSDAEEEPGGLWSCNWAPTYNDDWHDDVLCTRGFESKRPILLPDSDFVTEDEMRQAGREYEAKLNG
ncbi:hypothetical protein [Homoserinibacter sp. GY 40078]|uniref:hypothetical protein n=1 Tax=Homoserinibacter sp. GY 40078 TaxID=2603275 RepID=UPI0011C9ED2E|nr:hypothetical protein [Homoserinibacter sp. GY 40078]TXK19508.1 hypothetical protein FVQ89_06375 [Homoserinibacter sp. GY 40078]